MNLLNISNRLLEYFNSKHSLIPIPYKKYTAILKLVNEIYDRNHINVIIIDLPKAFDTIDHNTVIKKLHYYDISGTIS